MVPDKGGSPTMSYSPIEIIAVPWGIATIVYLGLFLIRSIVGMKEEDNLYLSAGESRLAEEQRGVMKGIMKWENVTHKAGYVALAMTIILAVTWGVSVFRVLF